MAFTMRAWTSVDAARGTCGARGLRLIGWLALFYAGLAHAGFSIRDVHSAIADGGLKLDATLDLHFDDAVVEALDKGIPLEIVIDVRLLKHRSVWWDSTLDRWEMRPRIQYHALSGRYVVTAAPGHDEAENFDTLNEALAYVGTLKNLLLPVSEKLKPADDYRLVLTAELNLESLPAPLQPLAYVSRKWRLWGSKKWKVGE